VDEKLILKYLLINHTNEKKQILASASSLFKQRAAIAVTKQAYI